MPSRVEDTHSRGNLKNQNNIGESSKSIQEKENVIDSIQEKEILFTYSRGSKQNQSSTAKSFESFQGGGPISEEEALRVLKTLVNDFCLKGPMVVVSFK